MLGLVPNATCDGPTSVAFPTRLAAPPDHIAARLRTMARLACARSAVVDRLNATVNATTLAPMTADTTPLRNQYKCRGESLLWAAGGIALAPFGPGLRHCRRDSVCWFALADCGSSAGAHLEQLLVRARFVGRTSIFAPHVAYLPLGHQSGVLLHWYCPPSAGNFTIDERLQWYVTSAARVRADGPLGERLLEVNEQAWSVARARRPLLRPPIINSRGAARGVGRGVGRSAGRSASRGGAVVRSRGSLQSNLARRANYQPSSRRSTTRQSGSANGGASRVASGRSLQQQPVASSPPLNVFLGGMEPRCPRGVRCEYDWDTAAFRALSRKCEAHSTLGGPLAMPLTVHVSETPAPAAGAARREQLRPCPAIGDQGLDGYWSDPQSAGARANAFAPTPTPAEELAHGRWVWATRGCVRSHRTREAARRCLSDRGRVRVHLHGDSHSRDLYVALADFLGIPVLNASEMKRQTNVLGVTRHASATTVDASSSSLASANGRDVRRARTVSVTQGYTWGSVRSPELLADEVLELRPHVIVTNFALAHAPLGLDTLRQHLDRWVSHWRKVVENSRRPPRVLIYQRPGAFQAARGYGTLGLQAQDELIMRALRPLGFVALEQRIPHHIRFDATDDGGHVRVNGSTMLGVVSRLIDLACDS